MNNRRIILEVSDAHRIALSHKEFALLYCEVFPSMQGYYKVDFYTLTNDDDLINHSAVCVLTEHGARKLLANESTIGESILLSGDSFRVVGIISSDEASEGPALLTLRV